MTKLIEFTAYHTIDRNGKVINTKTNNTKVHWKGANGYYYVDIQEYGVAKKYAVHRLLAITFLLNPDGKRTVNHIDGNKLNNSLSNLEWATDSENMQHAYDNALQPYRRKYSLIEYEKMLTDKFLRGTSITEISKTCNQSLTQLSLHLREAANRLEVLDKYKTELTTQKSLRAKKNGIGRRQKIRLEMCNITSKKLIKVFTSYKEATEYLKCKSPGPISNVLNGRQKSAYGYFWVKS